MTKKPRSPSSARSRSSEARHTFIDRRPTQMPGKPRAIVADAERQFPVRIVLKVPPGGIGQPYTAMTEWLDENCGIGGWSIASAGTRGILNDAVAVYVNTPTCAVGFVARWCIPGDDPPGFYRLREDEPEKPGPGPGHFSPWRGT